MNTTEKLNKIKDIFRLIEIEYKAIEKNNTDIHNLKTGTNEYNDKLFEVKERHNQKIEIVGYKNDGDVFLVEIIETIEPELFNKMIRSEIEYYEKDIKVQKNKIDKLLKRISSLKDEKSK